MTREETIALIENYYAAFNANDMTAFLGLLCDDVVHDINQGERQVGVPAFEGFMGTMNTSYKENLVNMVIMASDCGTRAAAEFVVEGEYLVADEGLPAAHGQRYTLPAGAFFEVHDNKVARISNYYNLEDWLAQVGA